MESPGDGRTVCISVPPHSKFWTTRALRSPRDLAYARAGGEVECDSASES